MGINQEENWLPFLISGNDPNVLKLPYIFKNDVGARVKESIQRILTLGGKESEMENF